MATPKMPAKKIGKKTTKMPAKKAGKKVSTGKAENMVKLYKSGLSLEKIGLKYCLSNTAVRARLLKAGVKMRGRGRPRSD